PDPPTLCAAAGAGRLRQLARQRLAEQRRQFGRGDEVAAARRHAADDGPAARVVAEAGGGEREGHGTAERDPAAGAVDRPTDESRQGRRYTAVVQALVHR